MRFTIILFLITTALLLPSCEKFDFNTYEINRDNIIKEATTEFNLQRLLAQPTKDTLHIVLIGDLQRFYDELRDFVAVVNKLPRVDAVIITGDLSDFGLSKEYKWINEELIKLKVPFLTVIGNHDCLANSNQIYERLYGPLNYSFTWNRIRFVMHNTNGLEYGFNGKVPDLNWMRDQLRDVENYEYSLFVSHVPPVSDDFDKSLIEQYTSLIRNSKNTVFSANGHRHNYEVDQPYGDNVWYVNTSSPSNRIYSYISIYLNDGDGKKFDCTPVSF
jgi:3',5'-cyclic-AMP phosphodiesterase